MAKFLPVYSYIPRMAAQYSGERGWGVAVAFMRRETPRFKIPRKGRSPIVVDSDGLRFDGERVPWGELLGYVVEAARNGVLDGFL